MTESIFQLGLHVEQALAEGRPIVALETSLVSHGLPYPDNIETALSVERCVVSHGAVPATIGIIDGEVKIGLNASELEFFATGADVWKVNCSDLPIAIARGASAATTVAATLICASLAGIQVVATGGIGGVHRDYTRTHDQSRDLDQLATTDSIVVASGIKSVLDIAKTLEVLETLGVTVITYGQDQFPAFWSRTSGIESPHWTTSLTDIASTFTARRKLSISGGLLIANPIPHSDEIPLNSVVPWIEESIEQAKIQGISGKGLTPFLLDSVCRLSGGRSVAANRKLVESNARVAARLATEISRTMKS